MKYEINRYCLLIEKDNGILLKNNISENIYFFNNLNYHTVHSALKAINECDDDSVEESLLSGFKRCGLIYNSNDDIIKELNSKQEKVFDDKKIFNLCIFATEQCNFRCSYCYETHTDSFLNNRTSNSILSFVEYILGKYDSISINWFGGEPLLALDTIRYIMNGVRRICKNKKKTFWGTITTNGYLLKPEIVNELIRMHILQFQVTIDGNRERHNAQRFLISGAGTYDTILKNLKDIKKNNVSNTIAVIVRVNIYNDFLAEMIDNEISELANDRRFSIFINKIIEPSGRSSVRDDTVHSVIEGQEKKKAFLLENEKVCYAAKKNYLGIRTDGTIIKCTFYLQRVDNAFGNINSLKDYNQTHGYEFGRQGNNDKCIDCAIYPICWGRKCPASAELNCSALIKNELLGLAKSNPNAIIKENIL